MTSVYIKVRPANGGLGGYLAFGKRSPFQTDPNAKGFAMLEPGDLWFEFGNTPFSAMAALLGDMVRADLTEINRGEM